MSDFQATLPSELQVASGAIAPPGPAAAAPRLEAPLRFTGSGAEYFRIWVVNTTLTLLTLGIYSAWAKVRKASYFARNTRLLGDSFDFSANPWAILRGRVLALVLLGFYTFAFEFSLVVGLIATSVIVAAAPFLLASANRFRLHNTRWRGIRFGFSASLRGAYRAALIVFALWVSGTVATALGSYVLGAWISGLVFLLLPWMHHRIKAFQHRHATFAGHGSSFESSLGKFYATYFFAGLLLFAAGAIAAALAGVSFYWLRGAGNAKVVGIIVGVVIVAIGYLAAWPLFAARIQRVVWERTRLGPLAFETRIAFRTLFPIAARNVAMLLVTAGLYWPFASIAWARYRLECMSVVSEAPFDESMHAIEASAAPSAVGEGAADFFGLDIGW